MSIRVMTAVFDHSESRLADRLVLLVIADRSNDDGSGCWRGKESIAHMARIDRATVTRCIAHLEELGELVVERRPGRTSEYRIVLEGVGANCAGSEIRGAQDAPGGRRNGTPTPGARVRRDPSLSIHDPSAKSSVVFDDGKGTPYPESPAPMPESLKTRGRRKLKAVG